METTARPATAVPQPPPSPKPVRDWRREYKTADTTKVLAEFRKADGSGSYPGRWEYFHYLGRPGLLAVIRVAFDAVQRRQPHRDHLLLAIQALADQHSPEAVEVLEELRRRFPPAGAGWEIETVRNELAHALARRGRPQMIEECIAELKEELRRRPGGQDEARTQLSLGHRYFHAGRTQEAVQWFERTAATFPMYHGNAYYNVACAWSSAGQPVRALAALRRAVLIAKDRLGNRPPNLAVPFTDEILDALREAHRRGFQITHHEDYAEVFGGMHGVAEFEPLWQAMGGKKP